MSLSSFFRKISLIIRGVKEETPPQINIPVEEVEKILGYKIRDINFFKKAFIHRSYVFQNHGLKSNERLEFLGDAFLNFIITDFLFNNYKKEWEGELTKKRSLLVNKKVLAEKSKKFDLSRFLFMSQAEDKDGGRDKTSILANTLEAVIGAIYIDGGFEEAKGFIREKVFQDIVEILQDEESKNYKGELIEYFQKKYKETPDFRLIEEMGPDHDRTYIVEVYFKGETLGTGKGKTKKDAEQRAALVALNNVS